MSWQSLDEELARWRDAGREVDFWWRDDDAIAPSALVRQLLQLSKSSGVPLALAVIPLGAAPELFEALGAATVLMHGTDHRNRASAAEKKSEFPLDESEAEAVARLAAARERLERLAGASFLPVLAPPWNRFKRSLIARLPESGLHGISGYGARQSGEPGVTEVNTHVDIIDWKTRRFMGEAAALRAAVKHLAARREGSADAREPTGWLTHHELHEAPTWLFLEQLFERTRKMGARWAEAKGLFPSRA
jgi:hypothetical protein